MITGVLSGNRCLILSPLEQSFCHLILFDDVDVGSPSGQGISVDSVEQGL